MKDEIYKKVLKLASELLKMASEEFANHGCNDVDESLYKGWSIEERQELVKGFHEWNGDPEEYNPSFLYMGDDTLMSYLSFLILQPVPVPLRREEIIRHIENEIHLYHMVLSNFRALKAVYAPDAPMSEFATIKQLEDELISLESELSALTSQEVEGEKPKRQQDS